MVTGIWNYLIACIWCWLVTGLWYYYIWWCEYDVTLTGIQYLLEIFIWCNLVTAFAPVTLQKVNRSGIQILPCCHSCPCILPQSPLISPIFTPNRNKITKCLYKFRILWQLPCCPCLPHNPPWLHLGVSPAACAVHASFPDIQGRWNFKIFINLGVYILAQMVLIGWAD